MNENRKRAGRPLKPAETGKRVSLGLKVTSDIKRRLDAVAQRNGRTQSQEAEARLERTFWDEQMVAVWNMTHGDMDIERLLRVEQCARYLISSNAWVGDTDGIEANLTELNRLLNEAP